MITKKSEGGKKGAGFKIMYDQAQYSALYWLDSWVPKKVYDEIEKISGYKPEQWLLYGQAVPEAFFFGAYSDKSLHKESAQGLVNLRDRKFLQEFEKQYGGMYQKALKIKNLYEENFQGKEAEVIKKSPDKAVKFLEQGKKLVMSITRYYFLTQPQRFYGVERELGDIVDDKNLLILMENGRSLSPVLELRYQILSFSKKVKKSGMKPSEFIAKNAEDWEKALGVINDIGFLNQGLLGGEIVDEKNFLKETQAILKDWKSGEEELAQLERQKMKIKKRKQIFEKNKASEKYKLAEITGQMLLYRIAIHTYLLSMSYYLHRLIDFVFSQYGIKKIDGCSYLYGEVIELLKSGKKLNKKDLAERQKAYLIKFTHKGGEIYYGERARAEVKEILDYRKKEITESTQTKGTVASISTNQHLVRGRAFVLSTALGGGNKSMEKSFKEGDILIATQTHPNLVPIMKRAKAIVADEGGLTCHAAIVSRELGKTCIIGTRIGTKIFKTGDTVELDMKRGVIKKIK